MPPPHQEQPTTSSYFIHDDELHKVFQLYSKKAEVISQRRMDLFGLKCAILHLYGDHLKRNDLTGLIPASIIRTFSEFVTIARHYENSKYPGKKQLLQQCFMMIDKKNKGYVTPDDVKELLIKVVPHLQKKQGNTMFETIDKLGIGKITFPQFCSLYSDSTGIHVY